MKTVTGPNCLMRDERKPQAWRFGGMVVLAGMLALTGCAHRAQHTGPLETRPPAVNVEQDGEPEGPKDVPELLRQAESELQKANAAHENGDFDTAFEHYQRMLKLLLEADLDPALYYESSGRFEEILRFYLQHAHLYHNPERRLGSSSTGVYSDITIPFPLPQPVLDEIAELQTRYSGTFQRGLNRSSRYMPFIREEFRAAGLPEDLAWLAMVESMFQPKVVSHAGAGGMWQFMRATGRRYNLRMDSYVDERYNWHSATRAAAEYLKTLHDFFNGDWALAVTAYNMGEGGLDRAITANGGQRDFWSLICTPPASERIKPESKKYFPRLLAYIVVANAPEQYGFSHTPEPYENVKRIPVQGSYHLADLEKPMGLSKGTLAALNPDLVKEVTPPHGQYAVAVPGDKTDLFLAALESAKTIKTVPPAADIQYAATHRVRRGETISCIAKRYGVDAKELMRVNHIRNARSLQANQVLQVPGASSGRLKTAGASSLAVTSSGGTGATAVDRSASTGPASHTVIQGDTLSGIARKYKLSVEDLQKINGIKSSDCIRIGQVLKLGTQAQPTQDTAPLRYHEVRPGEYPGIIAKLYGMSTKALLAMNNLTPQSVIRVGDRLAVSGNGGAGSVRTASATKASPRTSGGADEPTLFIHKVAAGETASTIAARHGVKTGELLACNNLTAKSILRVGQKLTVPKANAGAGDALPSDEIRVSQAKQKKVVHTVTAGQNPSSIARRYGVNVADLFKWNNWSDAHVLHIGDEVSVYTD